MATRPDRPEAEKANEGHKGDEQDYPASQRCASPYGVNERMPFKEYAKDMGYLSPSRTRAFLDPYVRIKLFSGAKFDQKKYEEDKEKVLNYYNSLGYRDAQIIADTQYYTPDGNLNVDIKVAEGPNIALATSPGAEIQSIPIRC